MDDTTKVFRHLLLQEFGWGPFAVAIAVCTVVLGCAAFVQRSLVWLFATVYFLGGTLVAGYLQYYIWRRFARDITATPTGLTGKPFMDRAVSLPWDEIHEVATVVHGLGFYAIEIRGSQGAALMCSDLLPGRDALFDIIRTHAPHCQFHVKDSLFRRVR